MSLRQAPTSGGVMRAMHVRKVKSNITGVKITRQPSRLNQCFMNKCEQLLKKADVKIQHKIQTECKE